MASGAGDNSIDLRALEAVSEYSKNLMCLVCHCPFITPTRLRCDHIFCRSCLDDCIKSSSDMNQFTQLSEFLCPTCRTPTNATYTTVPRLVVAMCDDILVRCPYHGEGCTETIQRSHAQVHVDKYCEYRWMPCPDAQCDKKIRKKDLGSEDRCLHTLVDCGKCGESVIELDFEEHTTDLCPQIEMTCPDCEEVYYKINQQEHKESCLQATVPCKASKYGCVARLLKAELKDHEDSCPLGRLGPYLESQAERLETMDSTIRQLKQQNSFLEDSIASLRSSLSQSTSRPPSRVQLTSNPGPENASLPVPDLNRSASPSRDALASSPMISSSAPYHNNATTYLLSIHEALREEVLQLTSTVADLEARTNMSMMNDTLRVREDMAHLTAGLNTVRMQVHLLMNSRIHHNQRAPMNTRPGSSSNGGGMDGASGQARIPSATGPEPQRGRRPSDSGWEGTKL
ncbi:TRAF-type zinc finger protein [Nannizzia gypsea CBS 118893]|uniref:TRAF-type zinc finger protein n=1 Tax=Arthroderma gypseum (strain ATCC MYA-4604 / CBS 118893) TaxID=535722 RepID=E4UVT9_ARTGP|nr:TRAF-type zinc finger protein [Nannizzia gypsea CBS 118893]EFR02416.1 TRAF-type zinc finger protein [Nannizzia gypsea CBS 118893]